MLKKLAGNIQPAWDLHSARWLWKLMMDESVYQTKSAGEARFGLKSPVDCREINVYDPERTDDIDAARRGD